MSSHEELEAEVKNLRAGIVARTAGEQFRALHPEFYPSQVNAEALVGWAHDHDLPENNLSVASWLTAFEQSYAALKNALEQPPEESEETEEVAPEPLTEGDDALIARTNKMGADEFKRFILNPKNAAAYNRAVEKLERIVEYRKAHAA